MRRLSKFEIFQLCVINQFARMARRYNLANAVFIRLLIEACANKNEWKISWLTDENNDYYDLVGLKLLDSYSFEIPEACMPAPLLKNEIRPWLYLACYLDKAMIKKNEGNSPYRPLNSESAKFLWDMFFEIVHPEEIVALVHHNFVRQRVDTIIDEIEQRAQKIFTVRVDWFDTCHMEMQSVGVLAFDGFHAIEKTRKKYQEIVELLPINAFWTAKQI